jgi:putative tryptophan/tyrosine transport system substrate-binding protein
MRRREFIALLGSAAVAAPVVGLAQQPGLPIIGFINSTSLNEGMVGRLTRFHQGLRENGFVEGENVAIEYRWAENQIDQLPALAADLVRRRVGVIVATGGFASISAVKAATTTIPVVFLANEDPAKVGVVASLARPGGNLTGVNFFSGELVGKRLELLRELVPAAKRMTVLINPENSVIADTTVRDVEAVAAPLGLQIQIVKAANSPEIDGAFASFARERPDALFVGADPYFTARRIQIVQHAAHSSIPATYASREIAQVGGLMSYGASIPDAYHLLGVYAGRLLKGAKPSDLPVTQANKFELIINHQTARILGLTVPPSILAIADEVIE